MFWGNGIGNVQDSAAIHLKMGREAGDIISPINIGEVDSNSFSSFSESNILSNCQDSSNDGNSQIVIQ